MKTLQWKMNSPVGPLYLVASAKGLHGIFWKRQSSEMAKSLLSSNPGARVLAQAIQELEEYFKGTRRQFQVPLHLQGTLFQKSVWNALKKIPYGKTYSYRDIARKIKNPKAVRAVGSANGKNPVCIMVPCHRVIAANGTLGGYAGGLPRKRKLLSLEGKII